MVKIGRNKLSWPDVVSTHSYLITRNDRNVFPVIPVIHLDMLFIDCVDVADVRQTFYNVNNLSNIFTNVAGDTIFKFLKEINLYIKI